MIASMKQFIYKLELHQYHRTKYLLFVEAKREIILVANHDMRLFSKYINEEKKLLKFSLHEDYREMI
jgi:hypothetical protein